jgi:predicted nucleic acid-binding protein
VVDFYFFDSSALVKRYVTEIGSAWVQAMTHPQAGHQLLLARITWVEVLSALARLQREGNLAAITINQTIETFRYDWETQYRVVELDQLLTEMAGRLVQGHPLRAYDGVQLAAALRIRAALVNAASATFTFVTADWRLLAIAQSEGLVTIDPSTMSPP